MVQNEEDTKEQALQAFCEKVANTIKMMPEEHRYDATAIICFTAVMCGADGNPFVARGIAAEVTSMVDCAVQEHHDTCTGTEKGDDDV